MTPFNKLDIVFEVDSILFSNNVSLTIRKRIRIWLSLNDTSLTVLEDASLTIGKLREFDYSWSIQVWHLKMRVWLLNECEFDCPTTSDQTLLVLLTH